MKIEIEQSRKQKREFTVWVWKADFTYELFFVTGEKALRKVIQQFI
jgi:hypothetical protein